MKVYISKPRSHWLSPYTIAEKVIFWRKVDILDDPLADKIHGILLPVMQGVRKVLNLIHPQINYVKIDKWDTWSMDSTLSPIILTMLKQLKKTKFGSPTVDDEDVPKELQYMKGRSKKAEIHNEELIHERWDWVLNEMIFAFSSMTDDEIELRFIDDDNWDALSAHWDRVHRGLTLFGKYYRCLWD